ncbi:hypothetical protein [Mycolicibacterium sphagni]|uniref:Carboxyltransferase domain-containing protein n=1 Tax=Mycolicibacterium sphagni TaxID=1786 RepID=A0ABX2K133_9MYCO|nr:hypothetical protein [Mycolicibacterium sphagni]NTY62677.1 hypothetical protein [Mycolicibacterium sphagni]
MASVVESAPSDAAAGAAEEVVLVRLAPAVDLVATVRPLLPTLEPAAVCLAEVERPLLPTFGPVLVWLDDAESPPVESA